MKRHSEVIYTSSTPFDVKYQLQPSFNFQCDVRLVDYSFTDDEDCVEDAEVKHSLRSLRSSLAQLGSPVPPLKMRRRCKEKCPSDSFSRDMGTRLSLKLQDEKKAEILRNQQLISQVTGDLLTSMHVCQAEAPRKRRKLDLNFIAKRISLHKGHKTSKSSKRQANKKKTAWSDKILGLLHK